jgi:hypothetical protein
MFADLVDLYATCAQQRTFYLFVLEPQVHVELEEVFLTPRF